MKLAQTKRLVRIAAIIAIAMGAALVIFRQKGSERQIEGKPLSDWVRMLGDGGVRKRAHQILASQGSILIPELLQEIKRTRGISVRAEDKALSIARFLRVNKKEPVPWAAIRAELFLVISEIGATQRFSTNPPPELKMAVDALAQEVIGNTTNAGFYAVMLGRFGDHAQSALPALMSALRSKPTDPSIFAGISEIGPRAFSSEVISIATNNIFTGEEFLVYASIRAIGRCGSSAMPAVPLLVKALDAWPVPSRAGQARSRAISKEALAALARIGGIPSELKPRLQKIMEQGNPDAGEAALAMLRIDPGNSVALGIVRTLLDARVENNFHNRVVSVVAFTPPLAALFEPELQKLAARTNTTSPMAQYVLAQLHATNAASIK